ncbi:tRNA (adenosine(37)-N6)-dimethylallyltransferase MiaA [Ignavibacteria bacterium]|nr:tRNA (adenosine(37)-N6)-dimethylallyltransferase MiaA [Bacteroidota bacterium]MCZ2132297.1 tRNA (adenosine(37)-N6)-dimethylallyltransferase MiaA [Bacteroidota bacterium]
MEQPSIIVIAGPTAAGKTATALAVAERLGDCAVISADSRQIYRCLDIGTAKPTPEERTTCPHFFIDILNPDEYYSAGRFADEASAVIRNMQAAGKRPIVVGGTGLYIASVFEGIFNEPQGDYTAVREELNKRMENEGREALYAELDVIDPAAALRYSDKNPRRILRALEFYYATGSKFSEFSASRPATEFQAKYYGITPALRGELYARINRRSEEMWNGGLPEETERILAMGYSPELNALNTVGYKETIAYLRNEISAEQALESIQRHTRNYAKRQITWLRRNASIKWLCGTANENAAAIAAELEQ